MAVAFAERPFGLQHLGIDITFNHDLGFGRHQQIDRARAHDVDRLTRETAGDVQFFHADR